ncbi:MAG: hypothetical protein JSW02_08995 [candidate division WOR-3 bacterium]|nr:MAG: hypothetical protein JSW02_08995 [candidate division WOR-3 bacterium]
MVLALTLSVLTQAWADSLDVQCNTITLGNGYVYCAPFSGSSFFKRIRYDSLVPITFTDDQNSRIIEFHVTPFTAYLYNGLTIDKYYLASGDKEPVYGSRDISTFLVTPWEELIIADRKKRELIFLDFTYDVKYRIFDLNIKDICMNGDRLFVLTDKEVLICDELCNEKMTVPIPASCDRIFIVDGKPAVYLTGRNRIHIFSTAWQKKSMSHTIQDIASSDSMVYILGDDGFVLYNYPLSNFR